jgi:hypothetical protein
MPKYLAMASYTSEGIKGLNKVGGTARRAVVEKLLKSLGGHLEAFYFAFGENDAYLIRSGHFAGGGWSRRNTDEDSRTPNPGRDRSGDDEACSLSSAGR